MSKKIFEYNPADGEITFCPKETQSMIYNRYKEKYNLSEEQMWDYGMTDWEELDEADLSERPSDDVLSALGEDMQLIWAFVNDHNMKVDFEIIEGMTCGEEVLELMYRLGFVTDEDSGTGHIVVYG